MSLIAIAVLLTADPNPWQTQRTEPILIKTRAREGTDVKEIWAEGDLAAAPGDIQDALTDVKRMTDFMPYLKESRFVGGRDPDGAQYTYQKMEPPLLSARDFIHKVYLDRDAHTDPQGVFSNHWSAVPDALPQVDSVVRLKISEGGWVVTPSPDKKSSHVIYRLCVDPAGAVPAFAANRANASGLTDTFKNIEREAQRRAAARRVAP
jgi:hypothetical protein